MSTFILGNQGRTDLEWLSQREAAAAGSGFKVPMISYRCFGLPEEMRGRVDSVIGL